MTTTLAFVDVETTGLDPRIHQPYEVCVWLDHHADPVTLELLWRNDLTTAGLDYVRTGAWHKVGSTPQFSGDRPATAFEAITICHPTGKKRWNGGGSHAWWSVPIVLDRGGQTEKRVHTTQKPESLMRALVDQFTDPGDLVLDAFGGSGTTAAACRYLGRRCVLIEHDEARAEVAAKRLSGAQDTLFADLTGSPT